MCLSWIQHPTHSPTPTLGWNKLSLYHKDACHLAWASALTLLRNSVSLSLYSLFLLFLVDRKLPSCPLKLLYWSKSSTSSDTPSILAPLSSSHWHCFLICKKQKWYLRHRTVVTTSFVHSSFPFPRSPTMVIAPGTVTELLLLQVSYSLML